MHRNHNNKPSNRSILSVTAAAVTSMDLPAAPQKNDTTASNSMISSSFAKEEEEVESSEQIIVKVPEQHLDGQVTDESSDRRKQKQPPTNPDIVRTMSEYSQMIRTLSQSREEIIKTAWAAESSFRTWLQKSITNVEEADSMAKINDDRNHVLSILLKIWRDCTSVLADLHQQESYKNNAKTKDQDSYAEKTQTSSNKIIWDEDTIFSPPTNAIVTAHDAAQHAEDLLLEYQPKPTHSNVYMYEIVLDTWVQSKYMDAHGKAQRLLDRIRENNDDIHSVICYVYTMEAYCLSANTIHQHFDQICSLYDTAKKMDQDNRPNAHVRLDNTMILALARMARRSKTEKEDNKHSSTGGGSVQYAAEDYARQALQIFRDIPQRNVHSYEAILEALSRTGDYKTADQVFADLKNASYITPSIITYTWLIHTYALAASRNPNLPQRAMDLLQEILDPSSLLQPNAMLFNSVITCWVKSQHMAKAAKAVEILKLMEKYNVKPTVHVYNSALEACARTSILPSFTQGSNNKNRNPPHLHESKLREQQLAALKIAFAILKLVERDGLANHVIFATMLKGVGNLLPASPERNDIASKVFAKAKARGLVDGYVLACLKRAVDADVFYKLLAPEITPDHNGHWDFRKLPHQWSRNIAVK